METIRRWSLFVPLLLLACGSRPASEGQVSSEDGSDLALSIAVPEVDGVRPIFVTGSDAHFHVVLRNRSAKPVRLWRSGNSWGHQALRFSAQRGQDAPVEIRRRAVPWLQNAPAVQVLAPGDSVVFDVYFARDDWESFPLPAAGGELDVTLQAVYEVPRDKAADKHQVWTGRIESLKRAYRFEDR